MRKGRSLAGVLATFLFCSVETPGIALSDVEYVKEAMSSTARDFDSDLPDQAVNDWLRSHIPSEYQVVWGEHLTACGESTGTSVDPERDMPLCVEVELKEGPVLKGALNLLVGTTIRGLLKDEYRLYFGYLEHGGKKYDFKRLRDVLKVK